MKETILNKLRLALVLRTVRPEKFDMQNWLSRSGRPVPYVNKLNGVDAFLQECGTAACVAGWGMAVFCVRSPERVVEVLGLNSSQMNHLFFGEGNPVDKAKVLERWAMKEERVS